MAFNSLSAGVLADVNGDGCLDAVVADGNGFVWVLTGDCSDNFTLDMPVPMGDSNGAVSAADINGDGHLDIVTTTIPLLADDGLGDVAGNMLAVALGDGKGNFDVRSGLRGYWMNPMPWQSPISMATAIPTLCLPARIRTRQLFGQMTAPADLGSRKGNGRVTVI